MSHNGGQIIVEPSNLSPEFCDFSQFTVLGPQEEDAGNYDAIQKSDAKNTAEEPQWDVLEDNGSPENIVETGDDVDDFADFEEADSQVIKQEEDNCRIDQRLDAESEFACEIDPENGKECSSGNYLRPRVDSEFANTNGNVDVEEANWRDSGDQELRDENKLQSDQSENKLQSDQSTGDQVEELESSDPPAPIDDEEKLCTNEVLSELSDYPEIPNIQSAVETETFKVDGCNIEADDSFDEFSNFENESKLSPNEDLEMSKTESDVRLKQQSTGVETSNPIESFADWGFSGGAQKKDDQNDDADWACFETPTNALIDEDNDEFADFSNFATSAEPEDESIELKGTEYVETVGGGNDSHDSQTFENSNEEFDDFPEFSAPLPVSGTQANNWTGTHQMVNGFSNKEEEWPGDDTDIGNVCSDSFRKTSLSSIDKLLCEIDAKGDSYFIKDSVVNEDSLLLQDFFVSMSIGSDVSKQLNEEVDPLWSLLSDLSNSSSLILDVQQSTLNSQLLASLGVDVNNTLSAVKQNLPKYAAQLGLLQPMKSGDVKMQEDSMSTAGVNSSNSGSSNVSRNNNHAASPTPDAVPDVEFDWGTSGLKNPLEKPNQVQSLSLDFFDSQFNSCSAASATSQLEEELLFNSGGCGGGEGDDNLSLGGTSGVSRDSKLASILAAAQSSSHENVMTVAIGPTQHSSYDAVSMDVKPLSDGSGSRSAKVLFPSAQSKSLSSSQSRPHFKSGSSNFSSFSSSATLPNQPGANSSSANTWSSWLFNRRK